MEAFSIKINTEGCLVFSLSVSPPSSVAVLSQFCRWLDVVYRSRCLFLSCLRKIAFSFFFFYFFLRLSYLTSGWVFSLLLHTRFFLLFCFLLFPSFFLSLSLSLLFDSYFVSVSFLFFSFFPPRTPPTVPHEKFTNLTSPDEILLPR